MSDPICNSYHKLSFRVKLHYCNKDCKLISTNSPSYKINLENFNFPEKNTLKTILLNCLKVLVHNLEMENVLMEFLEACVHQILYHRRLYPPMIFVKRLLVSSLKSACPSSLMKGKMSLCLQWVETNQSNFCIYPTDIRLSPPHGTTLMAYADVRMDVSRY